MPYDIIVGRDDADKIRFGNKGLIKLGKGYVKMGQYTSLSNPIFMDIARTHVVLVSGKRGCLTEDTMIFTDKGYKKITDFNKKGDKVLSFNKDKKEFEWENADLLEYDISNENLIEVELDDGRKIKLTKEHPLLLNYGKYLFWRMAQELKVRDKIILPTNLPEIKNDKESLRIARILGFVLSDGTMSKRKGRWKDGRGYWYDGTKSRLRIFCDDDCVLRTAKEDLEKEFGLHVKEYKRNDCNCSVIQSLHAQVINKINRLGVPLGNKAGIIRIPDIVWESSNKFKEAFISALFSCDGFISKEGRTLEYYSKSRRFLEDLQMLLTHLEIESVIRKKDAKCNGKSYENYRLFITDNLSIENFKKIGFISKYKQERLEKHKNNNTKKRKTFYFSGDLVCRRINNIKEIRGIKKVYDLSIDKNHSFIANGIISHNSGKSYTLGVIAEELATLEGEERKNISSLIFDTMGIFWTMKFKNEKEKELLAEWQQVPKDIPIKVFVPYGYFSEYESRQIPVDEKFSINPSDLKAEDWIITFNLNITEPIAIAIERAVSKLKERGEFDIKDIISEIIQDNRSSEQEKNSAIGLFEAASTWKVFSSKNEESTDISSLIKPGQTSVLDLSVYSSVGVFNVRALVISIVSRKLFEQRILARKKEEIEAIGHGIDYLSFKQEREMPLVWLFIDEVHEFLPDQGKTPATDALIQLLREGRQPGISMVMATQQPGALARDAMTQADIVLSHRVTSTPDIQALNQMMQSYLLESIKKQMDDLPNLKGSAIILDDNSERLYPMRVKPRFTWHGGEAPTALKVERRI